MTLDAILAKIRAAMYEQNLTAADLARSTGRSQQEIGRWLNGRLEPTLANLQVLAGALGFEVGYYLRPEDEGDET